MNDPSATEFDEVYYEKLMDGLEFQEILCSELEFSGRIDAEYYQKQYLAYEQAIERFQNVKLSCMADFLIGPFGSSYDTSNYVDTPGFRYIRGQDVKPFILKNTDPRYMNREDFNRLLKYSLKADDILVSVVGTLGNACIVSEKDLPAVFSCKSTVIRANNTDPYFLTAYLNSKYGRSLLLRKERGVIQKGLNLDDLKTLKIPLFSKEIQNICKEVICEARRFFDESDRIYREAADLLEQELKLQKFHFHTEQYSIKSFKNSFEDTGRLDAEFYQQKYDDLFTKLSCFPCKKLGSIVDIRKSIEPGSDCYSDKGIPFVRVGDISEYGIIKPTIKLPYNLIDNIEDLFPAKGTILLSKDGSVGTAYKMEEPGSFITSGAILHLHVRDENEINLDYLTLVLNSRVVRMQAERDAGGSIIQHWKPSEIEEVVIPVLDKNIQNNISDKIKTSFELRRKSQIMLEQAVCLVETAIEQGEEFVLKKFQ